MSQINPPVFIHSSTIACPQIDKLPLSNLHQPQLIKINRN